LGISLHLCLCCPHQACQTLLCQPRGGQDDDHGLVLQSTVDRHIITIDPQIISHFIRVPVLELPGSPYNEVVLPPSMDDLREFFHAFPQGEKRATTIQISALSHSHRLLAKIVQHNLWPVVRPSDLILKKAQFVYAIHRHLPFLGVMLEARDEGNTGPPFGCLLTQIILQSGINITGEPKMKIQQPINKQTLMKSNAQLRRDDSDDEVPIPASMPVGFPDMASSSQTVPPSEPEVNFSQIMEALAAIQGRMSTMPQSITSIQQKVHCINKRVEQNRLDLRECLKYHHPGSSDDEDEAPRTAPMAEDA